jgi:hypothetical protein
VDVLRSHPPLLVDDELARAIRSESALALRYWWGVRVGVVARWRKAFGVERMDSPGSAHLIQAAAEKGAQAICSTSSAFRQGFAFSAHIPVEGP